MQESYAEAISVASATLSRAIVTGEDSLPEGLREVDGLIRELLRAIGRLVFATVADASVQQVVEDTKTNALTPLRRSADLPCGSRACSVPSIPCSHYACSEPRDGGTCSGDREKLRNQLEVSTPGRIVFRQHRGGPATCIPAGSGPSHHQCCAEGSRSTSGLSCGQ